jgi:hypothetical protein
MLQQKDSMPTIIFTAVRIASRDVLNQLALPAYKLRPVRQMLLFMNIFILLTFITPRMKSEEEQQWKDRD